MTEHRFDFTGFQGELEGASAALRTFAGRDARRAGDEIGASFERAGQRIARAMGAAARDSEGAFRRMAKIVLEEIARIALTRLIAPAKSGAPAPSFAAFAPRAQPGAPIAVHFHISGGEGAGAIARHQGQIAAAVARAVAYGRRNL